MADESHGWANRETWLVALRISEDRDLQESVHQALRAAVAADPDLTPNEAGEVIREEVASVIPGEGGDDGAIALGRVDWTELLAAFLRDLA